VWSVQSDTNTGKVRTKNQDALLWEPVLLSGVEVLLCAVADGMGGHLAGDVASSLAVGELKTAVKEMLDSVNPWELLSKAVMRANNKVYQESIADPSLSGMGTTLTAALVFPEVAYVCHVGDSRAYSYGQGALRQLTNDHSYVEELIRKGELSKVAAEIHPQRNLLTRALGVHPELEIDCQTIELNIVDVLLLCTDGLSKLVSEQEILEVLKQATTVNDVLRSLMNTVLDRGAPDNVTVLLIKRREVR